jgi:hypothetical protein
MINLKRILVVLSFLITGFFSPFKNACAQEMVGMVSDRYAGIHRGLINPAATFDSPNCVDVSFLTGNFSIQNNYFYFPKGVFSLRDLGNLGDTYFAEPGQYLSERLNTRRMNGFQHTRLLGPSFLFKYQGHAIGFISGARSVTSMRKIPGHLLNFKTQGLDYAPQQNIQYSENKPFSAASLGWAEVGLSYPTTFAGSWHHNMAVGITSRYLMGYHALSLRTDNLVYEVNGNREMLISRLNLSAMGSLPFDFIYNEQGAADHFIKGTGFSFDLGFTFSKNSSMATETINNRPIFRGPAAEYKYRLGFSILDIGGLKMKKNARRLEFSELDLTWIDPRWEDYENLDQMINDMEIHINSGEIAWRDGEPYWVGLPTATSLQFDYNLGNGLFAYAFWVQDLPLMRSRVARASQLGIVPRYETRWFAFALPITLYDYKKPRLGFSLRLAFLTIGTEQPGGMFNVNDMDGMDLYFSVTWGIQNCYRRNPYKPPRPTPGNIY